ncbi:alpha-N-arabinofuranosidase [Planctomycetota bacterium]
MKMIRYYTILACFLPGVCIHAQTTIIESGKPNTLVIHADQGRTTIAREIYGHFAEHLGRCIYDGLWVGEDSEIENIHGLRVDAIRALKQLNIPVLRWPGGCFADEYHWQDGIGPREERIKRVSTHWGMVTETNQFGTHEFLELCELLKCEAYVAGNVGSGTVEEMQNWIEYMTFDGDSAMANLRRQNGREKPWRLRYFGVGNENWGCGGNMNPEYYADLYLRYQTYVRDYSGNDLLKIACGPGGINYHWMEVLANRTHRHTDAISMHYYVRGTGTWSQKGSASDFDEREWFYLMKNSLGVDAVVRKNKAILDQVDPDKRIGLAVDEWGTWWDAEPDTNPAFLYQQNTLRDALSAGILLNTFNYHCDRVRMANIAQTVNVLQAMLLTDGPRMILTPTYHVFEMYKSHQGALHLPFELRCTPYVLGADSLPSLHASASRNDAGEFCVTLCHLNPSDRAELELHIEGALLGRAQGRVLTAPAMNSHNSFDDASVVVPRILERLRVQDNRIQLVLPAMSITVLSLVP